MRDRNTKAGRRDAAGDRVATVRTTDERAAKAPTQDTPFHGALHSDHPQDPFRKLFTGSSLTFEF